MRNLAINLPVMIGHKIPPGDNCWEAFLLLIDIVRFCTVRIISRAHAGILEALICQHQSVSSMLPTCIYNTEDALHDSFPPANY